MIAFPGARRLGWSGTDPILVKSPRMPALFALLAWTAFVGASFGADVLSFAMPASEEGARGERLGREGTATSSQWRIGGYGGMTDTIRSVVRISNPPGTEMTISDFDWLGRPFKAPVYYGARIQRLPFGTGLGAMLDFTHAKAIAEADDRATLTGTRNGAPVPPKATVKEVFRHLEFSHGHNMLTLNGLWRMPAVGGRLRPYFGGGAGISLPHTEIGFQGENARTYEYQFAGFVGQALGGIEISLGRMSLFVEYKFSYAPYRVPLSHEPYGWLLVTDLWRQFRAWTGGEKPPGGWLETTLATHHGIGGLMVRLSPAPAP